MIFYIDDTGERGHAGFSALGVPWRSWKFAFDAIAGTRKRIRDKYGIPMDCEFHATEFIGGRGKAGHMVKSDEDRASIFHQILQATASIQGSSLINAFDENRYEDTLFERMLTRIDTCCRKAGSHAILICDRGKEEKYRGLSRKLRRFNPIPSQYGQWQGGGYLKNITHDNIIEDTFFRDSGDCYFIQAVDFCAYALLRFERPVERRPWLASSINLLDPILNTAACRHDPTGKGIVRIRPTLRSSAARAPGGNAQPRISN